MILIFNYTVYVMEVCLINIDFFLFLFIMFFLIKAIDNLLNTTKKSMRVLESLTHKPYLDVNPK